MLIMKKITNKMTKEALATSMQEVMNSDKYVLKDKSLVEMVTYTLKKYFEDATQVLKDDLLEVATELYEYVTPKQTELKPVETKLKPVEETETEETKKDIQEPTETDKKPLKATTEPKKLEPKKSEPTEETEEPKKTVKKTVKAKKVEKEETFKLPEKLETEQGDLVLNTDIENLKQLKEAVEEGGRQFYIAVSWTKKDLKQFVYSTIKKFTGIKSFPNDFDVSALVYITDDVDGVYAMSMYTEYMGFYEEETFEQVEGVRYVNTAPWGLYENLDVLEEQEDEGSDIKEVTETKEEKPSRG